MFEEEGRIVTCLLFFFPSLSPLKYSLGKTKKGNETLSGFPQLGGGGVGPAVPHILEEGVKLWGLAGPSSRGFIRLSVFIISL